MKVNGSTDSIRVDSAALPAAAPERSGRSAAPAAADSVSQSDLAGYIARLRTELGDGAPFDAARVEAVKAAIQNGEFKINADAVADQLIAGVRELLATKS